MLGRSSKRRFGRALLALACALALSGCGEADDASPPTSTDVARSAKSSPLRERLDRMITSLLTDRGLEPRVTACALDELDATLSDRELESAIDAIRNTGAAPPGVIEAAAAAGEACGRP